MLTVIGLARGLSLQDLVYVGLVGICDPPKPHIYDAISTLMASGVRIKIVTGDAKETAAAVGNFLLE
jgi:Ca2+-transporting ATPase